MRVLVSGGRTFGDLASLKRTDQRWREREDEYNYIMRTLDLLSIECSVHFSATDNWLPSDFVIISGGATGADSVAEDWAIVNWCNVEVYKADWDSYGRRAGAIRNQKMLDVGKPDLVVAFPGSRGTADMMRRARKAGVETVAHDS